MLVGIIVVLLITRRSGRASGALGAGSEDEEPGCPNATRPPDTLTLRRTPRLRTPPRKLTATRPKRTGTPPWCDDVRPRSTTRRRCRTKRAGDRKKSTLPLTVASTTTTTSRVTTTMTTTEVTTTTTSSTLATPGKPTRPSPIEPRTRVTQPGASSTDGKGKTKGTRSPTKATRMPLVCTVGSKGTAFSLYPPPGVCSHVFFTHVLVSDGTLHASDDGDAWRDFVRAMRGEDFADYPAGISFDARYYANLLTSLDAPAVRRELEDLAANNIKHYGILNFVTRAAYMVYLVAQVAPIVMKMRQVQGGDRSRHIVLAAGLWNYNEAYAWATYQAQFRVLAGLDVDILISISSVGTMETDKICFAAPPTVWNATSAAFAGFAKHATLLLASEQYTRQELYVGLSFEMGVTVYQLQNRWTARELIPYAPCTQFTLVGYEQVCDPHVTLSRMDSLPAEFGNTSSSVFFYDSWDTMKRKVDGVMKLPVRKRIAWLLFDTHLSDSTWECTGIREREKQLRKHLLTFGFRRPVASDPPPPPPPPPRGLEWGE
ncbi:uncharacterized protein LOC144134340 [Amblyomma americanum]